MTWAVRAGLRTSRGPCKHQNEDTAAVAGLVLSADSGTAVTVRPQLGNGVVALIADGMGGHVAGRFASRLVAERLSADPRLLTGPEATTEAILAVHESLYEAMERDPSLAAMGTTVVGIAVPARGDATIFNVGDSRLLVRNDEVGAVQLSIDDAERRGTGTSAVLTQCLGGTRERVRVAPHVARLELNHGDRFLLCSDGLTDVVSQDQIAEAFAGGSSPAVAHRLVELARSLEATDDVTVVVIDVMEEE